MDFWFFVSAGQSEIKSLKREREQLRREIWYRVEKNVDNKKGK